MRAIINSLLTIQDAPKELLEKVKAELTLKNPDYIKKKAMGLNPYTWGPELIKLWSEREIDGVKEYVLPRGYYARLWELMGPDAGMYIRDGRALLPDVEFPLKPKLRDYQGPAVRRAKDWEQGVVIMPCGSGKTNVGLSIAAEIGQPALWITHTMDLLQQSMDRAAIWLGLSGSQIGVIQGSNMRIGTHITFATVQTLAKRDLSELRELFGCIIIDEAHMVFKDSVKARMFESVISQFPAYYRFGVTASEYRSDGLIDTMFHVIGPKIYEVTQQEMNDTGNVISPKIEFIETDFTYELTENENGEKERLNVQQLIAAMRRNEARTEIVKQVLKEKVRRGDFCLVLGDSLEYLEELRDFAAQQGRAAAYINGNTPKKQREKIMADMRAGRYQYLFATYQLAKLGLDIPILNRLLLATPKRDKTSIQQAVGRIMRPAAGKDTPVTFDIWDSKVPQLRYWVRDRVRVYQSLRAKITGGPKVRKQGGQRYE